MERSTIFHGKIHYFYGHVQLQNVSSPEGNLKLTDIQSSVIRHVFSHADLMVAKAQIELVAAMSVAQEMGSKHCLSLNWKSGRFLNVFSCFPVTLFVFSFTDPPCADCSHPTIFLPQDA